MAKNNKPGTQKNGYTRGKGLLEPYLAKMRSNKANALIPPHLRNGRILDIGCGSYPYFLSNTYFKEKFAVDQLENLNDFPEIHWHVMNLSNSPSLPFGEGYFQVITMLAVIEHLNPQSLVLIFKETHRVLASGGVLILTTPSAWADSLLHWMARLDLVSAEEINEHVYAYTLPLIGWYFGTAGYEMEKVKFGYFEFGLNMWGIARK